MLYIDNITSRYIGVRDVGVKEDRFKGFQLDIVEKINDKAPNITRILGMYSQKEASQIQFSVFFLLVTFI